MNGRPHPTLIDIGFLRVVYGRMEYQIRKSTIKCPRLWCVFSSDSRLEKRRTRYGDMFLAVRDL